MQVTVMIIWHFKETITQSCYRMIFDLRAGAMKQPGYICSDTLQSRDNPMKLTILSHWQDAESWEKWKSNPERVSLASKMEKCLDRPPQYEVFTALKLMDKLNTSDPKGSGPSGPSPKNSA